MAFPAGFLVAGIGTGDFPKDFLLRGLTPAGETVTGTITQTAPAATQAVAGVIHPSGTIVQTAPAARMSLIGGVTGDITIRAFKIAPVAGISPESHRREIAEAANLAMRGKTNNTGQVTLTASADVTTVFDERVSPQSFIQFAPRTANAATELATGTMYVAVQNIGSFVVKHVSNAETDRDFIYAVIG